MNRRDFLKIGALLSTAVLVQVSPLGFRFNPPVEVETENKIYRGSSDGKIFVSKDQRKTWQQHINFGPQFSVQELGKNQAGQVHTKLGFDIYDIDLVLSDDQTQWKTV